MATQEKQTKHVANSTNKQGQKYADYQKNYRDGNYKTYAIFMAKKNPEERAIQDFLEGIKGEGYSVNAFVKERLITGMISEGFYEPEIVTVSKERIANVFDIIEKKHSSEGDAYRNIQNKRDTYDYILVEALIKKIKDGTLNFKFTEEESATTLGIRQISWSKGFDLAIIRDDTQEIVCYINYSTRILLQTGHLTTFDAFFIRPKKTTYYKTPNEFTEEAESDVFNFDQLETKRELEEKMKAYMEVHKDGKENQKDELWLDALAKELGNKE